VACRCARSNPPRRVHGPDEAGLKEFRTLAVSQPMPPAGFKIKTRNEIEAENQESIHNHNAYACIEKG
jgi:hypothetical protein